MSEAGVKCVPRQWLQADVALTRWLLYARAHGVCDVRTEGHGLLGKVGVTQPLDTRWLV